MHSCCVFAAKAARRRGGHPRPAPMQGRPPTAKAPYKVAISCGHPQGAVACSQPYRQPPLGKADAGGQGQPPPVQGQ
ncbi:hypothetical protein GW17_00053682 [Ensete ventricosum]|nr:hypothetical protein GW17_00053682 [Ensete ventricosum]